MAGVFLPGDHRHVPIQGLHREAVVDAVVRALGAGAETLDAVGVGTVLGLVGVGCFSRRTPTLWNLLPKPAKSRTHPLALTSQRHQRTLTRTFDDQADRNLTTERATSVMCVSGVGTGGTRSVAGLSQLRFRLFEGLLTI